MIDRDTANKYIQNWLPTMKYLMSVDRRINVYLCDDDDFDEAGLPEGRTVQGDMQDDEMYLRGMIRINLEKHDTYQQMLGTLIHELSHFTLTAMIIQMFEILPYLPVNKQDEMTAHLNIIKEQTVTRVERIVKEIIPTDRHKNYNQLYNDVLKIDREMTASAYIEDNSTHD